MSIDERLEEVRINRHLSQLHSAEILNVHRTTISKYEKNNCESTLINPIKYLAFVVLTPTIFICRSRDICAIHVIYVEVKPINAMIYM